MTTTSETINLTASVERSNATCLSDQLLGLGEQVGERYVIEGVLGKGGMGMVYRALDVWTGKAVALKTPLPRVLHVDGVRQRFEFEFAVASALSGPHSVRVLEQGVHESQGIELPWMAMELLRGETLRARLKRCGRLNQRQALSLLLQLLEAMSEAHAHGVIHQDLKPENIFLCATPDGRQLVKVLDYGIAAIIPERWRGPLPPYDCSARVMGTPAYMAPEQRTAKMPTEAVDVYALGCITYHMLMGKLPYEAATLMSMATAHGSKPLPRLEGLLASTSLERFVHRAMAKRPTRRFGTVLHMAEALRKITAPSSTELSRFIPAPRPTRPRRPMYLRPACTTVHAFA